jgi:hypothetical protein
MLGAYATNFIFCKIKRGECLQNISDEMTEKDEGRNVYLVLSKSISQIVRPFLANFIVFKNECSQCLGNETRHIVDEYERKEKSSTLFCCRASARYCKPSSPIWFLLRFSVMSIYERSMELLMITMMKRNADLIFLNSMCQMSHA